MWQMLIIQSLVHVVGDINLSITRSCDRRCYSYPLPPERVIEWLAYLGTWVGDWMISIPCHLTVCWNDYHRLPHERVIKWLAYVVGDINLSITRSCGRRCYSFNHTFRWQEMLIIQSDVHVTGDANHLILLPHERVIEWLTSATWTCDWTISISCQLNVWLH
jgi:hypothetical protein